MINDDAGANEPRSTTLALTLAGVLAVGSVIGIIANYQRLEKDSLYCRQSGAYSILIAPETHQPCLVVEERYQALQENPILRLFRQQSSNSHYLP